MHQVKVSACGNFAWCLAVARDLAPIARELEIATAISSGFVSLPLSYSTDSFLHVGEILSFSLSRDLISRFHARSIDRQLVNWPTDSQRNVEIGVGNWAYYSTQSLLLFSRGRGLMVACCYFPCNLC